MPKLEPTTEDTRSQYSKEELKAMRERRLESLRDKSLWSPLFSTVTNSSTESKSKFSGPTTGFGVFEANRPQIPGSAASFQYLSQRNSRGSVSLPSLPQTGKQSSNNKYRDGRIDTPIPLPPENDDEKEFKKYYSTYLEPPRKKQEDFYKDLYSNPNLRKGHPLSDTVMQSVKREQMSEGAIDPYQHPGEHLSVTEYAERRIEMLKEKIPKPLLQPQVLNDKEEKMLRKNQRIKERLGGKSPQKTQKKVGHTKVPQDDFLNIDKYINIPNIPPPKPYI